MTERDRCHTGWSHRWSAVMLTCVLVAVPDPVSRPAGTIVSARDVILRETAILGDTSGAGTTVAARAVGEIPNTTATIPIGLRGTSEETPLSTVDPSASPREACRELGGGEPGPTTVWRQDPLTGDWTCRSELRRLGVSGSFFANLRGDGPTRILSVHLKMNLGGAGDPAVPAEAVGRLRSAVVALGIPLEEADYAAVYAAESFDVMRGDWHLTVRPHLREPDRVDVVLRRRPGGVATRGLSVFPQPAAGPTEIGIRPAPSDFPTMRLRGH